MATLFLSDDGLKAFDEMTIHESDPEFSAETLVQPAADVQALGFTEIGFAKPITIHIERVYTGEHPKLGWKKKKDMLITTAYKSENIVGASPRSFNWIEEGIKETHQSYTTVSATQQGTNLVYAKPAVDKDAIIMTIDLSFDDFDDSLLDVFSKILGSAGAIPSFSAYSPYLLVANKIANLGKDIGNRILDSKPEISLDAKLYFRRAGKIPVKEGKIAIVSEDFASVARNTFTISDDDRLVDKNSKETYTGNQPYAILSLDGAPLSKELQDFAPTLASAAQLKRFLAVNDGEDTDADIIVDALKLYSDYKFRLEAEELKMLLGQPDLSEKEKRRITDELNAITQNIMSDIMRPA